MKVEITKMQKVEVPVEYQKEEGCVALYRDWETSLL